MGLATRQLVLRRKRAITVTMFAAFPVLLSTAPAQAHAGYHHQQEWGTNANAQKKGIWWSSEVTNPSVPVWDPLDGPSAEHFVAPAWMSEVGTTELCTGTGGPKYMELGWGEKGNRLLDSGQPERFIYAFDSWTCQWQYANGVRLDPGETVNFAMVPTATCTAGTGNCTWLMQYLRDGDSQWNVFALVTMNVGNDLAPTLGTEEQNYTGGTHWQIAGADAGYTVDYYSAYFRHSEDGLWYLWNEAELPSSSASTSSYYSINYGTRSWRFWTKRTF